MKPGPERGSPSRRIIDTAGPARFQVADLEAVDGTPIIDVKPILDADRER